MRHQLSLAYFAQLSGLLHVPHPPCLTLCHVPHPPPPHHVLHRVTSHTPPLCPAPSYVPPPGVPVCQYSVPIILRGSGSWEVQLLLALHLNLLPPHSHTETTFTDSVCTIWGWSVGQGRSSRDRTGGGAILASSRQGWGDHALNQNFQLSHYGRSNMDI